MNTKNFISKIVAFAVLANVFATGCAVSADSTDADVERTQSSSQALTSESKETGGTITITSGTYGANCGVPEGNRTSLLTAACDGKESCDYTLTPGDPALGDPAPYCPKSYVAKWTCSGDSVERSVTLSGEAAGKTAILTCGADPAAAQLLSDHNIRTAPQFDPRDGGMANWMNSMVSNPFPAESPSVYVEWNFADRVESEGLAKKTNAKQLSARAGNQQSYALMSGEPVKIGTNIKYRYVLERANGERIVGATYENALGLSLRIPVAFDKVTQIAKWENFQRLVNPDPTRQSAAFIEWGASPDHLTFKTNERYLPASKDLTALGAFETQQKVELGSKLSWRFAIRLADGKVLRSEVRTFDVPDYDAYKGGDANACAALPQGGLLRVAPDLVISCTRLTAFSESVMKGSGHEGVLHCPADFPINVSSANGSDFYVKLPVIPVPIGPFLADADIWRTSVDVRLNGWAPGANKGYVGTGPTDTGWQKWSATNWNPAKQQAQVRIYCTDRMPEP